MNRVRIFISSPGDVADERQRALTVVERLQAEFSESLTLEPLLWEQEPLLATADFQSQIRSPADFDIFATMIGSRLGSPLGSQFTRRDGTTYASGTEFEFEAAIAGYHATGKPEMLVYRKARPEGQPQTEQQALVEQFFDRWFLSSKDRTAIGAYHTFADGEQFEDLFTLHLRKLLRRFLPRPNNLGTPLSSFVGRVDLVREVSGLIRQSDVRLVTLVGPGGTGKSRLGLRLAQGLLADFEDGAFLVTLADLRQADLVPGAIASALDIRQTDDRPIIDSVVGELQNREMLLLIDNLEQVQSAVKHINTLVAKCPKLKVIVTSREALRVSGARTVRVPPFALPDPKKATFAQIRDAECVQLFVDRATTVRDDFALTEENAGEVLELCHRLDGLPLAIELATSRLRSMNTSKLLRSMEKRFAVLKGGADDLLDHQRSLKELIAWSYELLSEDEQTLWRRMAVFTGGCTVTGAEEVCDPDDEFVVDIEVEGLVDKSLANLTFITNEEGEEEARISMLGTLREYALQKLEEAGETEQFQALFGDWAVKLADRASIALRGAKSVEMIELLDRENVNIQGAIDYYLHLPAPDWNRALQLGSGVWFYWFELGMLSSSRALLEHALEELPGVEDAVRARALRALGPVARFQNDLETAERACLLSLALCEQLDNAAGQGNVLGELGAIAQRQGDMAKARDYLDRALTLFEQVPDDLHGISFACAARGVINHLEGDVAGAKRYYEQALETGSQAGDTDSIASALVNLGEVAEAEADYEQAYAHYRKSLELFARRGKKVAIAYCAEIIAGLSARHRNKPSDAAIFFGFASALREEINSPIEPFNAERLQADMAVAEAAMTPETYRGSWQAGASLDVDEFLIQLKDMDLSA
jgi:non-specific serine/threonine protein kinase